MKIIEVPAYRPEGDVAGLSYEMCLLLSGKIYKIFCKLSGLNSVAVRFVFAYHADVFGIIPAVGPYIVRWPLRQVLLYNNAREITLSANENGGIYGQGFAAGFMARPVRYNPGAAHGKRYR